MFVLGVEIFGECEIIDYLVKMSNGDDFILVVDLCIFDWVVKGIIFGVVNIFWIVLNFVKGVDSIFIGEIFEDMTAEKGIPAVTIDMEEFLEPGEPQRKLLVNRAEKHPVALATGCFRLTCS